MYFGAFNSSLADRCKRKPYEKQALFTGSRYVLLLGPLVSFLLDADKGPAELAALHGLLGGDAGDGAFCGGFGGGGASPSFGATPPVARHMLPPGFANGAVPGLPSPPPLAPQPAFHPASLGQGGWQGYWQYSTYPP